MSAENWGVFDTEQDCWAARLGWTKDVDEAEPFASEAAAAKWIADHGLDETVKPMRLSL
jgi:hypothetical protein